MKCINIIVKGKVQGVWFRKFTKEQAIDLNIAGFVKNLKDGSVFVYAQGEAIQLEQFIACCKIGPKRANVSEIIVENTTEISCLGFSVK